MPGAAWPNLGWSPCWAPAAWARHASPSSWPAMSWRSTPTGSGCWSWLPCPTPTSSLPAS